MGISRVYVFYCRNNSSILTILIPLKVNILIDQTGTARLVDFGLLTIISDPTNLLASSSNDQSGTARWMSPELIYPEQFKLKYRPTTASDCYALGMVIYETISGRLPFHEHAGLAVAMKVLNGERPRRGRDFTDDLWKMLKLCWKPELNDRPSVTDVLLCLERASNPSEPASASPPADEGPDDGDDDCGSTPCLGTLFHPRFVKSRTCHGLNALCSHRNPL